jgi:hypothetical protein
MDLRLDRKRGQRLQALAEKMCGLQDQQMTRGILTLLLLVFGLAMAGCAEKGEPIQHTPEDRCMVRACSVYY